MLFYKSSFSGNSFFSLSFPYFVRAWLASALAQLVLQNHCKTHKNKNKTKEQYYCCCHNFLLLIDFINYSGPCKVNLSNDHTRNHLHLYPNHRDHKILHKLFYEHLYNPNQIYKYEKN